MTDNKQCGTRGQIYGGPHEEFVLPHQEFRARLQSAWPSADSEHAVNAAFAAYAAIIQEPWRSAELGKRATDAYAECSKRLHDAFASGGVDQILDAYRCYVQNLKRLWTDLDPATLAPEDLGAIAQGMSWVAGVTLEVSAAGFATLEPRS